MKARAILIASLGLLMVSCGKAPSADKHTFERKEFTHTTPKIVFVEHRSQRELVAAAPKETQKAVTEGGRVLMAWAVLSGKDKSTCTVHIVDPAVRYAPEWIGHEVTHCIYGRWHQ